MNIILSAYGCNPKSGSESSYGWGWLKELSRYHDVFALVYDGQGQKEALSIEINKLYNKNNIHINLIKVPRLFARYDFLYRIRYQIWYYRAFKTAQKIIIKNNIDLIHHVTTASWWTLGYLWRLKLPYIIGPVSGGQNVPFACFSFLDFRSKMSETARRILIFIFFRIIPRVKHALKNARFVLCSNIESLNFVSKICDVNKLIVVPEVGIDKISYSENSVHISKDTLSLLWAGRFIPTKNLNLVLEAVSLLPSNINWRLTVLGEGQMGKKWKILTKKLGIQDRVIYKGMIPYSDVEKEYHTTDIFLFPSLREATGTVVLEALAAGIPVIALNLHGCRTVLNESCGILIPVTDHTSMVNDFKKAIVKLYESPELRTNMGKSAMDNVRDNYLWSKKVKYINTIYDKIVSPNERSIIM